MKNNLNATIDRLGFLKAQIAELQREEKLLKGVLIEQGPGRYEGDLYCAFVSKSVRETLDLDAVRKKLSAQFIQAHTNTSTVNGVKVLPLDLST